MLRRVISFLAIATALFWGVGFMVTAPAIGVGWILLWAVVLLLDYQLYVDTAPPPPLVEPDIVEQNELSK